MTLARDFEWLQAEVSRAFGVDLASKAPEAAGPTLDAATLRPSTRPLPLQNIQLRRNLARIGASLAVAVGMAIVRAYLFDNAGGGHDASRAASKAASMARSVGYHLLTEEVGNVNFVTPKAPSLLEYPIDAFYSRKVDDQRRIVAAELKNMMDFATGQYYDRLSDRIRQLYGELVDDMKREQSAWRAARVAALQNSGGTPDDRWQALIDEASALRNEILATLAGWTITG
jgi:hypothetical protein